MRPQPIDGTREGFRRCRCEEDCIALARVGCRDQPGSRIVGQEFRDRTFRLLRQHQVRHAGQAERLPYLDRFVEEAARSLGGAGRDNRPNHASGRHRFRKYAEARVAENLGDINRLERVPQIGLVAAVRRDRFIVRNTRKGRPGDAPVGKFRKQARQNRFDRPEHILLLHERHLQIELIKLARRSIRARIFVAKAGRNLKVAVEARYHQQLLELLRRLRQRVEPAGMNAARHEIIARAFGRARGENGRLIFEESGLDHPPPDARDHP